MKTLWMVAVFEILLRGAALASASTPESVRYLTYHLTVLRQAQLTDADSREPQSFSDSLRSVGAKLQAFSSPLFVQRKLEAGVSPEEIAALSAPSKDALRAELKRLRVSVESDRENIFDAALLSYLAGFFTQYPQDAELKMASKARAGHELVWREGDLLYFNVHAGQRLATTQLLQKTKKLAPESVLTLQISHELFFSLARLLLTREQLTQTIEQRFRVEVSRLDRNHQPFSREELLYILKQMMDLPDYITRQWALKRLTRYVRGYEIVGKGAAEYNPVTKTIAFADLAFEPGRAQEVGGEGTILHEIGHAVWLALSPQMRASFAQLSWVSQDRFWSARSQASNFVSSYSARSLEEDFAEHFAYFVNRPLLLKSKVPDKFEWLRRFLFMDAEYFEETASNARVYIPSENPDRTAPVMRVAPEKAVEIKLKDIDATTLEMTTSVQGVFDDLSGVALIQLEFVRSEKPQDRKDPATARIRVEFKSQHRSKDTPGLFQAATTLDLKQLPMGPYTLTTLYLKDQAGNDQTLQANAPIVRLQRSAVPRRGDAPEVWQPKDFQHFRIEDVRSQQSETSFYISAPLGALEDPEYSTSLVFVLDSSRSISLEFSSATESVYFKRDGGRLRAGPFVIPRNLPAGPYTLHSVRSFSNLTERYKSQAFTYAIPREDLKVHHESELKEVVPIELSLEQMKLAAQKQMSTTLITVRLPLKGLDRDTQTLGWFSVQTPTGKIVQANFTAADIKKDRTGAYLDLQMALPENHEQGVFELRELMVWEGPALAKTPGQLPFGIQNFKMKQERFMQRGINKSVQIRPELKLN